MQAKPDVIRVNPLRSYVLYYYMTLTLGLGMIVAGLSVLAPQIYGTTVRLGLVTLAIGGLLGLAGYVVARSLGIYQVSLLRNARVLRLDSRMGEQASFRCDDILGIGLGTIRYTGAARKTSRTYVGATADEVERSYRFWAGDIWHVLFADVRGRGRVILAQGKRSSALHGIAHVLCSLDQGIPAPARVALYRSWDAADMVRLPGLFACNWLVIWGLALAVSGAGAPHALWVWGPPIALVLSPFVWISFARAFLRDVNRLPGWLHLTGVSRELGTMEPPHPTPEEAQLGSVGETHEHERPGVSPS